MEGNSYNGLLKLIKNQGYNKDVEVGIGEVSSTSPFQINYKGLIFDEDDFIKTEASIIPTYKVDDRVLIMIDSDEIFILDKITEKPFKV